MPQLPLRPQQEDTTPDHVYVKFYPARIRRLIREKKLTMSLLGYLTVLALRIDESNGAFPSQAKLAEDAQVTERAIQIAIKKLAALGAIALTPEKGKSNAYTVCRAFGYGKTPDHMITPQKLGGDHMITPTPDHMITPTPDHMITLREPKQEQPKEEKPTQDNTVPNAISSTEKVERETRHWRLQQMHVKEPEAYLIAYQYSLQLIDEAINSARTKAYVGNTGAYIRRICELQEGPIQYNTKQKQIPPPLAAAPPIDTRNPYLRDEYFTRHSEYDDTQEYIPADIGD